MIPSRSFVSRLLVAFALLMPLGCNAAAPAPTRVDGYKIVATYPHSTQNYTEGFFYRDGLFYEGTGMLGRSALLVTQPDTGKVVQRRDLDAKYFGEGIIDWGPNLYQWTWETHIGFVYDRFSMRLVRQFTYTGEGWGMTRSAKEIITSDGTAVLRFRNPESFAETRHILVKDGNTLVGQLNELEYIKGEIYANVWHSERIARISPKDGHVIAWIDLTGILPDDQRVDAESVLNGIAYDAGHDRLFVTGKQWPKIFEIKIVPKPTPKPAR
jgi:glutaminyl-peptide cyclotransferase